jgi:hypothetical protein
VTLRALRGEPPRPTGSTPSSTTAASASASPAPGTSPRRRTGDRTSRGTAVDHDLAPSAGSDILGERGAGASARPTPGVNHTVADTTGLVGSAATGTGAVRISHRSRLPVAGTNVIRGRVPTPVGILEVGPVARWHPVKSRVNPASIGSAVERAVEKRPPVVGPSVIGAATIGPVAARAEQGEKGERENREKPTEKIVHPETQSENGSGFNTDSRHARRKNRPMRPGRVGRIKAPSPWPSLFPSPSRPPVPQARGRAGTRDRRRPWARPRSRRRRPRGGARRFRVAR